MAALVNALDMGVKTQLGQKGHVEYSWSSDMKERILQLSFQITRANKETVKSLSQELDKLLKNIIGGYQEGTISLEQYQEFIITAYKMVGHTRDVISGKGEYTLSYMQIVVWYNFFPELALFALSKFVAFDNDEHPYGSWKDIKYFCAYCKEVGLKKDHPLIQYAFSLMNEQIKRDVTAEKKSLSGKWCPREGSHKFGLMFNEMAYLYFNQYLETAKTEEKKSKAQNKCKMDFRKLNSAHNKILDTIQIKQCGDKWEDIDHGKTTSITLAKQKKALLNLNKDGEQRSENPGRIQCAINFEEHISKAVSGEVKMKGRHVGMDTFVKQALYLLEGSPGSGEAEMNLLNQQWLDNSSYTGGLGNIIPMVDNSGSMFQGTDAGYVAIGLGIRCAEKSLLGKRVMVFNEEATWVNLAGHNTFVEMVQTISQISGWANNTNFYAAMNQILGAIKTASPPIPFEEATSFVLAIFSDMQMDVASNRANMDTLNETMITMFAEVGMEIYGKPLKHPHILYWNMSSSKGFPALSTATNASMLSGWSPALLNLFCEKGLAALETCTPWSQLQEMLRNERYNCLGEACLAIIAK